MVYPPLPLQTSREVDGHLIAALSMTRGCESTYVAQSLARYNVVPPENWDSSGKCLYILSNNDACSVLEIVSVSVEGAIIDFSSELPPIQVTT